LPPGPAFPSPTAAPTAPTGPATAGEWATARDAFESLAAHLLDHERQENAVVQDGYNEDLGLG